MIVVVVVDSSELEEEEEKEEESSRLFTMQTVCLPTGPFRNERICSVIAVGREGERR